MMPKKILALTLFLFSLPLFAQEEFFHPELNWRTIETEHFYVHYHTGTERTARTVAKIAEEIYGPITTLYHHEPDGKVSFVIKDYDDYSNGGSYFFDNKIEIWASALDFDLRGTHNWLRNVVTHEFTHMVQIQTALKFGRRFPAFYIQWLQYQSERRTDVLYGYPNGIVSYPISGYVVPSWFAEGVAQYNRKELGYDSWDSQRDMILRMYALDNRMLTWGEMSVFGKTSLGNESSYNAGFALVRYIGERYGDDKLEAISRNLASLTTMTIDRAIKNALGIDGQKLYDEWHDYVTRDYQNRTADIRSNPVEGEIIGNVGFGNFYPAFSPDGKTLAYVSNKESDYFSLSSLYLYDLATKTEKRLKSGVRSSFSWAPDGRKIYYAKTSRSNDHWSNIYDLYLYDIDRDQETRLTHGMRANSPAVSPDGSTLAYVAGSDGTLNLYTMKTDGSDVKRLTSYSDGEQVYDPKWSPDGSTIIFDYSIRDGRDVYTVPASGGSASPLIATPSDERNAVYTPDGKNILFCSDKTGIFNLYQYNVASREISQITNVLGGVFMPAVNGSGQIAFSSYTSTGFKLSLMNSPPPLQSPPVYQQLPSPVAGAIAANVDSDPGFDWQKLRSYDDSQIPPETDTTYKNIVTSLSLIPFLRIDNYNPRNKGIDVIKPGLYAYSSDMLDRYGFLASAAINKQGERDLFFTFDYRGKIPGLFQLGLEPTASLEAYNITRKTENSLTLRQGFVIPNVELTYNLLEFDAVLREKFITEALDAELRYTHSRYNADISSFVVHDPLDPTAPTIVSQAYGTLYLIGNDISLTWRFKQLAPSSTQEINPVGRKVMLRYDYEFNSFNPNDSLTVDPSSGLVLPFYEHPDFHRLEGSWREMIQLPGWDHTLSAEVHGGAILGPQVDQFFNFYIGGLTGMRGYPFYSLGGNRFAYSNLTYRFPLSNHIDLRAFQIYFDKLYASVYGDVGSAWMSGPLKNQKMKYDAGAELRLEAFSYYAFPTCIFFSATYGFNQFRTYVANSAQYVTYGKEWNFHFGVLFGFDLD